MNLEIWGYNFYIGEDIIDKRSSIYKKLFCDIKGPKTLIRNNVNGLAARAIFIVILSMLAYSITRSNIFLILGLVFAASQFVPVLFLQLLGVVFLLFFGILMVLLAWVFNDINMIIFGLIPIFFGFVDGRDIRKYFKNQSCLNGYNQTLASEPNNIDTLFNKLDVLGKLGREKEVLETIDKLDKLSKVDDNFKKYRKFENERSTDEQEVRDYHENTAWRGYSRRNDLRKSYFKNEKLKMPILISLVLIAVICAVGYHQTGYVKLVEFVGSFTVCTLVSLLLLRNQVKNGFFETFSGIGIVVALSSIIGLIGSLTRGYMPPIPDIFIIIASAGLGFFVGVALLSLPYGGLNHENRKSFQLFVVFDIILIVLLSINVYYVPENLVPYAVATVPGNSQHIYDGQFGLKSNFNDSTGKKYVINGEVYIPNSQFPYVKLIGTGYDKNGKVVNSYSFYKDPPKGSSSIEGSFTLPIEDPENKIVRYDINVEFFKIYYSGGLH